jgi:hypothetical protein
MDSESLRFLLRSFWGAGSVALACRFYIDSAWTLHNISPSVYIRRESLQRCSFSQWKRMRAHLSLLRFSIFTAFKRPAFHGPCSRPALVPSRLHPPPPTQPRNTTPTLPAARNPRNNPPPTLFVSGRDAWYDVFVLPRILQALVDA